MNETFLKTTKLHKLLLLYSSKREIFYSSTLKWKGIFTWVNEGEEDDYDVRTKRRDGEVLEKGLPFGRSTVKGQASW